MKKSAGIALAGLMVLAMAGVSNAGIITDQAEGEYLESAILDAFNRTRSPYVTQCPLTPGDKAFLVREIEDRVQLLLRSGKYKNCIGWTASKNYSHEE